MNLCDLVGVRVLSGFGQFEIGIESQPSDWNVNDIQIGGVSRISFGSITSDEVGRAPGADVGRYIPGDMFASSEIDSFMSFETVQPGQDLRMDVSYVGPHADGAPFRAHITGSFDAGPRPPDLGPVENGWMSLVGAAGYAPVQGVMPMNTGSVIVPPGATASIVSRPQTAAFRPERVFISTTVSIRYLLLRLDGVMHLVAKGDGVKATQPAYEEADDLTEKETILDTPLVISFHTFGEGPMLFAIDERTGMVVLEAGAIVRIVETTRYDYPYEDDDEIPMYDDDDYRINSDGDRLDDPIAPVERIEQVERREHFLRFDPAGFVPEWWAAYETANATTDMDEAAT